CPVPAVRPLRPAVPARVPRHLTFFIHCGGPVTGASGRLPTRPFGETAVSCTGIHETLFTPVFTEETAPFTQGVDVADPSNEVTRDDRGDRDDRDDRLVPPRQGPWPAVRPGPRRLPRRAVRRQDRRDPRRHRDRGERRRTPGPHR